MGTHWFISPYVPKWVRRMERTEGWKKGGGREVIINELVRSGPAVWEEEEDGEDGEDERSDVDILEYSIFPRVI